MGNFIAGYGTEIVAAFAVANGFIALVVGQILKHRPRIRSGLIVIAGLLSAAAVGASFYKRHEEIARREEIRVQLGKFMGEGLDLMGHCSEKNSLPMRIETDEWFKRIAAYLEHNLGHSYVVRLASPAGAPINSACKDADGPHNEVYKVQSIINFRLDEFSKEIGF
jgi:F0F1-type ATP synthase membrane subunit c/vacuolar-type H+-ATPase subunit K